MTSTEERSGARSSATAYLASSLPRRLTCILEFARRAGPLGLV